MAEELFEEKDDEPKSNIYYIKILFGLSLIIFLILGAMIIYLGFKIDDNTYYIFQQQKNFCENKGINCTLTTIIKADIQTYSCRCDGRNMQLNTIGQDTQDYNKTINKYQVS